MLLLLLSLCNLLRFRTGGVYYKLKLGRLIATVFRILFLGQFYLGKSTPRDFNLNRARRFGSSGLGFAVLLGRWSPPGGNLFASERSSISIDISQNRSSHGSFHLAFFSWAGRPIQGLSLRGDLSFSSSSRGCLNSISLFSFSSTRTSSRRW